MKTFHRLFLAASAAALLASPAAAQRLGARTAAPEQMLGQSGAAADPLAEIEAQAAAAARHPFGTAQNPVRVGGPTGERAYLQRLRCADGTPPRIGARSDAGIGAYGSVVAAYALTCDGVLTQVVMDMYHEEHRESRAPEGFTLVS